MESGTGYLILAAAIYLAPWLLAVLRRHHNAAAIFVLNLLLGWTFIGWVVALVWSMTYVRPRWDGELIARGSPSRGVVALSTGALKPDFTITQFIGTFLFIVLVLIAIIQVAKSEPIGHAPYRGNAAPGMMNSGPEADYFNRAGPPIPLINPYGMGDVPPPPSCNQVCQERDARMRADAARVWCQAHPDHWKCSRPFPSDGRLEGAPVREGGENPPPDGRVVLHNGSLMRIVMTSDGYVDVFYERPSPGLPVLPGVRLLRGKWTGPPPQNLVAVAFVFPPAPCPPVPYGVRGVVDQSNNLVLFGPAPIVGPDCTVVGHDWTRNSELRFEQVR